MSVLRQTSILRTLAGAALLAFFVLPGVALADAGSEQYIEHVPQVSGGSPSSSRSMESTSGMQPTPAALPNADSPGGSVATGARPSTGQGQKGALAIARPFIRAAFSSQSGPAVNLLAIAFGALPFVLGLAVVLRLRQLGHLRRLRSRSAGS
jgi:hypothetical protein